MSSYTHDKQVFVGKNYMTITKAGSRKQFNCGSRPLVRKAREGVLMGRVSPFRDFLTQPGKARAFVSVKLTGLKERGLFTGDYDNYVGAFPPAAGTGLSAPIPRPPVGPCGISASIPCAGQSAKRLGMGALFRKTPGNNRIQLKLEQGMR
jgi:hypothetical protein